jgi:tetratricopeptide (TPR) repeat protein
MSMKCFVVMGFGKKTDYQSGRVLDLDKSYKYIIKPAATDAGLECLRADEIVHSGLIDVPMYEQLLSADVVIADISTSNANAFYELGVRHALRPYSTITIAEDKMTFPFDVSHLAVRKYQHLGEGIDYGEVERMRGELTNALRMILTARNTDSPVYTFFSDLTPPVRKQIQKAIAQSSPNAVGPAPAQSTSNVLMNETAQELMSRAEVARVQSDFKLALELLTLVRRFAPNDPFVIQRLALATYKSKLPDPVQALYEAKKLLSELEPDISTDVETLGLWGAVHKRLWDAKKDRKDLDVSLLAYEKGFYVKNDYYNGINAAYLYNLRAAISSGAEATADFMMARRIRTRVLPICDAWLESYEKRKEQNKGRIKDQDWEQEEKRGTEEKYWVLATKAEAFAGLGDDQAAQKYLNEAKAMAPASFMIETTEAQIINLKKLLDAVKIVD